MNSVFHNIYEQNIQNAYKSSEMEDYRSGNVVYTSYLSTVISSFKWGKLPKNVLAFAPEKYLCYWGLLGMFKDGEEIKIYPCYPAGALMENGEFEKYIFVAMNGKNWTRTRDEIALCYNNSLAIPSIYNIRELASKSTDALRAVDSALERSMIPAIIECDSETDMAQLSDLYDRKKNQLPFRLKFKDGFKAEGCTVNDIFDSRKYDMLQMWDVYVRYRNLFYTTYGVNNIEIQKRERLTEAEGSGNDEITRYTLLQDMYDRRQDFVKECKEKFDYDIEITVNRDSATVYNLTLENEDKIDDVKLNLLRGVNTEVGEVDDETREENVSKTDESEVE